ncbi:MAG TPA: hypothetical protein VGJ22_12540 [Anaerolineales bacterium]|jgi:hypothetical protein
MKIIKNTRLIERNGKFGKWISMAAIAVLGLGMYISIQKPELFAYSIVSLLIGFTLTQVGMYLGNRYGRSPRPDEQLDAGLKGLPGDFNLYHYTTPSPHLLVGPAGVWVLLPYHQGGSVAYKNNRWRLSGGGFFQGYMRIFGQESIGRPDVEAEGEIREVKKFLAKHMDDGEIPDIRAALIFTNAAAEVSAGGAPLPALKLKQLKDFIRQRAKERPLGALTLERLKTEFAEPA